MHKYPSSYIYDWNFRTKKTYKVVELNDETLRDGLQATYIKHLTLDQKKNFLQLLELLSINSANIGFPASSDYHAKEVYELVKFIQENKLKINLGCGARAIISDINPILEIIQKTGYPIEIGIFIGSSRIRQTVEKWKLTELGEFVKKAIKYARGHNAKVMFVTEDTTRANPRTIKYLYQKAIDCGAERICVCDTVGIATPKSTKNLMNYITKEVVKKQKIKIDWHGHNDRGLAVSNSIAAVYSGADRIQATALGVGERAGNTSMQELIVNLWLEGFIKHDLKLLKKYAMFAAKALKIHLRPHDPIIGKDVFSTATGVHAAAILKAYEMGRKDLAGLVYSSINPKILGRQHIIKIGPMSGKANVLWVFKKIGIQNYNEEDVLFILDTVKKQNKVINTYDVKKLLIQKNKLL